MARRVAETDDESEGSRPTRRAAKVVSINGEGQASEAEDEEDSNKGTDTNTNTNASATTKAKKRRKLNNGKGPAAVLDSDASDGEDSSPDAAHTIERTLKRDPKDGCVSLLRDSMMSSQTREDSYEEGAIVRIACENFMT